MLLEFLLILFLLYLLASIFIFFFANSNFLPNRRNKEYELDIPATLHYFSSVKNSEKKVAYWKAIQTDESKDVILLHGFTRTSGKNNRRANIYWDHGYNVYLVDNLGHGKSSDQLFPSGYRYSLEVRELIRLENIEDPIIHGTSMGAIAANAIAQFEPDLPSMIICEALPITFDNLYRELLAYVNIPYSLFPWLSYLSKKIAWKQFEGSEIERYDVSNISCPMFLIHSKADPLFKPEDHFFNIVETMADQEMFESWLVPDAGHTNMDQHNDYQDKLLKFVDEYSDTK